MKIPTLLQTFLFTTALSLANEKPNVILFYADDMGYGEIQRFHPEASKVPTPHLNKLCDEGLMFTDAHTSSSICTPSRYSLLTGRYNWRSKHQKGVTQGGSPCLITEDRITLPKLFQKQGYRTAMFGKWHLDFQYQKSEQKAPKSQRDTWNYGEAKGTKILDGPITRGFDHYVGFHHSRTMSSIITDDEVTDYVGCIDTMDHLTGKVVNYIKGHAKDQKEKPFFLYYPMNSPHAPVIPTEAWKKKDTGIEGDYPAFVAQTDDHVGQVLKALLESGLSENTIIIFGTDNGCHQRPSLYLDKGHSVSGPFRDKKASIYEGGHRIPFIVKWPGVTEAGSKTDLLICMTDLFATFAEKFSYDITDNAAEDSISFLPILKGQTPDTQRQNIVHHDYAGRFAVREGHWKLILAPDAQAKGSTGKGKDYQLYNLAEDIDESKNLANEHPNKVDTLLTLLEEIVADGRSTPGSPQTNDAKIVLYKNTPKKRK